MTHSHATPRQRDPGRRPTGARLIRRTCRLAGITGLTLLMFTGLAHPGSPAVRGQLSHPLPAQSPAAHQSRPNQPDRSATPPPPSLRDHLTVDSAAPPASLARPRPGQAPLTPVPTAAPAPIAAAAPSATRDPETRRAPRRARGRGSAATVVVPARLWPIAPASYDISQPFGCVPALLGYYPPLAGCPDGAPTFHSGLDLAAPAGTPILAAASGWVTVAGLDRPSGVANTRIVIQHDGPNDGYASEYYHWQRAFVRVGDYVAAGDQIAEVGSVGFSTGPHLHFSVFEFASGAQLDPVTWLPATNNSDRYAGVAPATSGRTFGTANLPVPDYADPAPAPPPVARDVPAAAVTADITADVTTIAGDDEASSQLAPVPSTTPNGTGDSPGSSTAADPAPAATTPDATTPTVDISRDAGTDAGQEPVARRSEASTPPPTAAPTNPFNPSLAESPLNPMVVTPTPTIERNVTAPDRKRDRDR